MLSFEASVNDLRRTARHALLRDGLRRGIVGRADDELRLGARRRQRSVRQLGRARIVGVRRIARRRRCLEVEARRIDEEGRRPCRWCWHRAARPCSGSRRPAAIWRLDVKEAAEISVTARTGKNPDHFSSRCRRVLLARLAGRSMPGRPGKRSTARRPALPRWPPCLNRPQAPLSRQDGEIFPT